MGASDGACRSCGKPIIWAKSEKGRNMPLDAEPMRHGLRFLIDPEGYAHHVPSGVDDLGHRSHFATCPNAKRHRKTK